ncbi:thiamine pyrophosphate enzyme, N-terminal TPP binding domain-containing protein [Aspergillus ambiguus]|uniref:thiamine pyrophosphate enzyme, N-terminal TPP binding domain-containing protein n=1 Tax=Aspergillus ambiguus TaxID=176160 RepID=UPI003CCD5E0D
MECIAKQIVDLLELAGTCKAFGVSGGYIFPLWCALDNSPVIDIYHCRSEGGAAFAAMEFSLHNDALGVVFGTSGPGISNAFTALRTARADGARLVFLSAITGDDEECPRNIARNYSRLGHSLNR